ncbi:hypothetical protein CYLTODRAFT_101655 [Cylindrobasidium torrendii FP15055 ss-10]|uniref:C2H2-type domain-containing protein n=1 Tax=Cylindrobasidium torrendii FP15055 ss-10 TaxID=1314674 RepID=A0A0D7B1C8_9AGAR|nr:hypothetical protein CYLTODRAFT_101655 [Cylindrobasidium torrendii FP15055 ss-10]
MPSWGDAPISDLNGRTTFQFDAGIYNETQATQSYPQSLLQPSPDFQGGVNSVGTYQSNGQAAGDLHATTYPSNYTLSRTSSSHLQTSDDGVTLYHPYPVHPFQHRTPSWSPSSAYSEAPGAGYNTLHEPYHDQALYGANSQASSEMAYHERGASHHHLHLDSYYHTSGSQSELQSTTISAASGSSPAGTSNTQTSDNAHGESSWPSPSLTQPPHAISPGSSTRRNEGRPTDKPKAYSCSSRSCLSTFTSSNARKRHEKDRHSGKQLTCKYCGMTFADSTSVPRHQKLCKPKREGGRAGTDSD